MYFETSDLKIHFLMIRNSEITIKYPYLGTVPLTKFLVPIEVPWSTSIHNIFYKNNNSICGLDTTAVQLYTAVYVLYY